LCGVCAFVAFQSINDSALFSEPIERGGGKAMAGAVSGIGILKPPLGDPDPGRWDPIQYWELIKCMCHEICNGYIDSN